MFKKFTISLIVVLVLATNGFCAAGIVVTEENSKSDMYWIGYTITANASASFADYTLTNRSGGAQDFTGTIVKVETAAGATAPTNGFDVSLFDSNSVNITGGLLKNRGLARQATPCNMVAQGLLSVRIEGNSVNNAVVSFKIFYVKRVANMQSATPDEFTVLLTDGQAFTGPGFVTGVLVGKSDPDTLTKVTVSLYDNTSAAGTKVGPTVFIEGSDYALYPAGWLDSTGWPVTNGCYVDFNNADVPGAEAYVKYRRN